MKTALFLIPILLISTIPSMNTSYAFLDFGGWEEKYNLQVNENQELRKEIEKLEFKLSKFMSLYDKQKSKITDLNNDNISLEKQREHWKDQSYEYYEELKSFNILFHNQVSEYNELSNTVNDLENDKKHLEIETNKIQNELGITKDNLEKANDKIINSNSKLHEQSKQYERLYDDYEFVYNEAYKSRVEIDKTKLHWNFYDSKGNPYGIVWDIDSYERLKVYSDKKSRNLETIKLNLDGGGSIQSVSLDGFVTGDFVECCIDQLYENSKSDADFIYEVWWIVSQMTVYDKDVTLESEGRFALETIHRGGGDCEDLVILIADMIKSSSYTKDWDIQYVYMDGDNPRDPKTVNHVVLNVYDGEYSYYIEATSEPRWDYYPNGVGGWWFDV